MFVFHGCGYAMLARNGLLVPALALPALLKTVLFGFSIHVPETLEKMASPAQFHWIEPSGTGMAAARLGVHIANICATNDSDTSL